MKVRRKQEARAAAAENGTYPTILREYASSGFRDGRARRRAPNDLRAFPAYRRTGVYRDRPRRDEIEAEDARERYGDGGPYWQRKG